MTLTERPSLPASILLGIAAGLLLADAFGIGYPAWVFVVGLILAWVSLYLFWTWAAYQADTQRVMHNHAVDSITWAGVETARIISKMSPEQLELWVHKSETEAYIRAMQAAGGDTELVQQVLVRLSDNLDRATELADRMRRAAAMVDNQEPSDKRWFAVDAVNEARKRDGWLPAQHGPQNARRDELKRFYDRLVREGAAQAAAGNRPPRVTDFERAEMLAKGAQ